MSDSGIKIEVHLIQNFAPSNLNRDDTGQPKSATFGGCRRARISSQCTKRRARDLWRENGTVTVGDRTKKLQELLGKKLDEDPEFTTKVKDPEERKSGVGVFTDAYYAAADKKKPENTSVLIFISPAEVEVCAKAIKDLWDDASKEVVKKAKKTTTEVVEGIGTVVKKRRDFDAKNNKKRTDAPDDSAVTGNEAGEVSGGTENKAEEAAVESTEGQDVPGGKKKDTRPKLKPVDEITKKIKSAQVSADIALFGRMLAEQPGRNTDGSCQVAHPISTHKVDMEMDFYTAVDDLNPAEETGAGMMGVVGFNSACYYRYALVDRDQLARNLAHKTEREKKEKQDEASGNVTWKYHWKEPLAENDYAEADKVIKAFLEAMVYAIPTGKQNTFAAQNLPAFGLFVRRERGVPISLANAFAKPVRPTKDDDDLVGLSVAALTKHWDALKSVYGVQGVKSTSCFHLEQEGRLNGLKDTDRKSVAAAIEAVMDVAR